MSSLFDAIRGAMMVMGGYGDTRRDEEKNQSEIAFKKGTLAQGERKIASKEGMAEATRKLHEGLQEKALGSAASLQEKELSSRQSLMLGDQEFRALESKYGREFTHKIEIMKINAHQEQALLQSATHLEISRREIEQKQQAMNLRRIGLALNRDQLNELIAHDNAGVVLKAFELTHPKGLDALYSSVMSPEQKAAMQKVDADKFSEIMKAVDPTNKLRVRDLKLGDLLTNVDKTGATTPWGATTKPSYTDVNPEVQERGRQAVESMTRPPMPQVQSPIDQTAMTPPPQDRPMNISLDPQDQFRLQNIAAFALKQSNPQEALQRGIQFIQSPDAAFEGHKTLLDPRERSFYNTAAGTELQRMFNQMSGKSSEPTFNVSP